MNAGCDRSPYTPAADAISIQSRHYYISYTALKGLLLAFSRDGII